MIIIIAPALNQSEGPSLETAVVVLRGISRPLSISAQCGMREGLGSVGKVSLAAITLDYYGLFSQGLTQVRHVL